MTLRGNRLSDHVLLSLRFYGKPGGKPPFPSWTVNHRLFAEKVIDHFASKKYENRAREALDSDDEDRDKKQNHGVPCPTPRLPQ